MGLFDRWLGKGREVRAARRAELRGELARAAELYGLAGAPEDAARVMMLRGDAETDLRIRMRHYTQAVATAPEKHAVRAEARRKRANLVIAQLSAGAASAAGRRELAEAAGELLAVGDALKAAEAFRLAGDGEGEAKALAQAGDVERLEFLLTEQQTTDREARKRSELHAEVEMLVQSGRRREALAAVETWLAAHGDDSVMRERASGLRGKRALGPIAQVWLDGKPAPIVLGDEVVIGRTEGTLQVPSQAVSRAHVRIAREKGEVVVRDLGSRNGTQLRGMNIAGALPVGEGVELTLGKEVRLRVAPSSAVEGAAQIEIGGATYVAPLGPARIPGTGWELRQGPEAWIELVANDAPPLLGDVSLAPRTTLLIGDVLTSTRGGKEILRVVGE